MKIHSAEAEHFMSFRDKVEFPLDGLGLVSVLGRNEVSGAADSNGSGKTSLIVNLPSWILFGKTPGGAQGNDVACRFTKDTCRGRMVLEDKEGLWTVTRTARPSTLTVEGPAWGGEDMKTVQARIEQRLGWGLKTFKNAIIFGQGSFERFSQAEQAEQLKMFDEIQGIDFTRALDRAEQWRKDLKGKLEALEQSIRSDEEGMGRLSSTVSQLEQAKLSFDTTQAGRVKELEGLKGRAVSERDQCLSKLEELTQKAAELQGLRDLLAAIEEARKVVMLSERDAGSLKSEREKEKRIHDSIVQQVEELLEHEKCPTCHAQFTPAAQGRVREANRAILEAARAACEAVDKKQQDHLTAHKKAVTKLEGLLKKWPYEEANAQVLAQLEASQGNSAVETAQREYMRLGGEVSRYENHLEIERNKRWEAQATLTGSKDELAIVISRLKTNRTLLDRSVRAVKVATYWVQAFGDRGIRSLLIDSVAGYLNERLAYHLGILAAGEVQVEISALSTLKSGKQKEDLSIVPVWAWGADVAGLGSNGQDRRVDLALFAALQDLAEQRSANPFPLKIWDEPGDALDSMGQEIFCDWVARETKRHGTGFLVTHSRELAAQLQPDQVWTVVLGRDGARLEREVA